jgi:hypothetical protein
VGEHFVVRVTAHKEALSESPSTSEKTTMDYDFSTASPGPEGHDSNVRAVAMLIFSKYNMPATYGLTFQVGSSSVMERNLARKIGQLCSIYRFFLARAKSQINQCLESAGRNPRAKLAVILTFFGLFLLCLRRLGHTGMRLLLAVRTHLRFG